MDAPGQTAEGARPTLDDATRSSVVKVFGDQAKLLQTIADEVGRLRQDASGSALVAAQAQDSSRRASEIAAEGANQVSRLEDLVQRLDQVDVAFNRLADVVERIASRVNVIEEIAFESNMLAINASIEAARAGETGKGFTVVATSMRDLSRQSRRAANEIADILESGRADIREIDDAWHTLRSENETVAHETVARFEQVKGAAQEAAASVAQIATAAAGQESTARSVADTALRAAENQAQAASEIISKLTGQYITEISPRELYRRLGEGGIRLIDVRRPDEWRGDCGHVAEATRWTLGDELDRELARAPHGGIWVFTCRMGGRSMRACRQAMTAGIGEIYNLTGGMLAWVEAGLPVEERTH